MNITFMIGNGFDRNLGLDTAYSDFVKYYKDTDSKNSNIKKFKENIEENLELWKDAEIALGQYTAEFAMGDAGLFFECQLDFAKHLSMYLKKESGKIKYEYSKDKILYTFSEINEFRNSLLPTESDAVNSVYGTYASDVWKYNFINFNYTDTLVKCLDIVRNQPDSLGTHVWANNNIPNKIGTHIHIHGTVSKEMIIGVNDESQIANEEIFQCDDGDLYKKMLIKPEANESYMCDNDPKAHSLIKQSRIIYIYGMSLGETDKIWWQRLSEWLNGSRDNHLIIYNRHIPEEDLIPLEMQKYIRTEKNKFLDNSQDSEYIRALLSNKVHITNHNIFGGIRNLTKDTEKFSSVKNLDKYIAK